MQIILHFDTTMSTAMCRRSCISIRDPGMALLNLLPPSLARTAVMSLVHGDALMVQLTVDSR